MKEIWEMWLENENRREKDFSNYLKSKKIKVEHETKELVQGHIEKADHNLKFVKSTMDLQEFNDWAITGAYYSVYQASLALCALKGYSTKDHHATLLVLIKEFYQKGIDKDEIEMIDRASLEKEHILNYAEAKTKRTKASYSTQKLFDKEETESLRLKAINFINKAKEIIERSRL